MIILKYLGLIALLTVSNLQAMTSTESPFEPFASPDPYADETPEAHDARMAWWREARFGMFIHWGVYSVPAGTYQGEQIPGIGEWIMLRAKIPVTEYKAYAKEFNPVRYDPQYWTQLAKQAGMRYIVITSKHHDGFALFPSAVTDWDIADASPYGRDLIGPLAEAARAEGLKFGLYYSQAQDWNHPGGSKGRDYPEPSGWDPAQLGSFDNYLKEIAAPQVGEILARYQPDILWWDTPRWMTQARAERLIPLLRIQPGIIHNNRLGGGFVGDTETPEQHIPATGFKDRDWEVCMTMNNTWGYKSYDHEWKSAKDLIQKLCDIVSKGGNFLLNVGPNAEGEIPAPSVERLQAIGAWMDVNSESIYGTSASPFYRLSWGRATKKVHESGAMLYLHIFEWPQDGRLIVPGLKNIPVSAQLLDGRQPLAFHQEAGSLVLQLPEEAPDPDVSVIRLEIVGVLDVENLMPRQAGDGSIELTPFYADLHNSIRSPKLKLINIDGEKRIGDWGSERSWAGWTFEVDTPGTFLVQVEVRAPESTKLSVGLSNGRSHEIIVESTGEAADFVVQDFGEVTFAESGSYQLELRPLRNTESWKAIELDTVRLVPLQ